MPRGTPGGVGMPAACAACVLMGVQVSIQVVYLLLLGEMDWATLPSMVLSAAAFIFRIYVAIDQSLTEDNQGE